MKTIKFIDFDLEIKLTNFINIIGPPASGKTTLLKMLINQIYNPNILIDDKPIEDYDINFKRKNLVACFHDLNFNTEYVKEELIYYQEKAGINKEDSFSNLNKFIKYFNLEEISEVKIIFLTEAEKALVKILSLLIINPKIIGIDTLLSYLKEENKLKIIKYTKENKISVLNITSESEELLLGTHIIVLDNFKVESYDTTKETLKKEKLLLRLGYDLPFIINLSNGLNYYDLFKKTYYDNSSLVEYLWK